MVKIKDILVDWNDKFRLICISSKVNLLLTSDTFVKMCVIDF